MVSDDTLIAIMTEGQLWCPEHAEYTPDDVYCGHVIPIYQSCIDSDSPHAKFLEDACCSSSECDSDDLFIEVDWMERIAKKYEERIKAGIKDVREELEGSGWIVSDIEERHDDDYCWNIVVRRSSHDLHEDSSDDFINIDFNIVKSEYHDGEVGGMNFSVDICTVGGKVIGGIVPGNYTEDCWVPRNNEDLVSARFRIIEEAYGGISSSIE